MEAIRLARLLVRLMPDEPEAAGLLALMLLHDARRGTRLSADGELVPLEDQDRTRWDNAEDHRRRRPAGRRPPAGSARAVPGAGGYSCLTRLCTYGGRHGLAADRRTVRPARKQTPRSSR